MDTVLYDRLDDDYDPMVLVIDDDPHIREGLRDAFESVNLQSRTFGSAEEFFQSKLPARVSCLVLDVRLPGLNGLDLQRQMMTENWRVPIIFITSHADDYAQARALEAGAVAFLYKPCRAEDLLGAIEAALAQARKGDA